MIYGAAGRPTRPRAPRTGRNAVLTKRRLPVIKPFKKRWAGWIPAGLVALALAVGAITHSGVVVAPRPSSKRPTLAPLSQQVAFSQTTHPYPSSLHMVTTHVGWGQKDHSLFRTTNGGTTWRRLLLVVRSDARLAASFLGSKDAWAATWSTGRITVFRTTDGGQSWRPSQITLGLHQILMPRFIGFSNRRFGWLWASKGVALTSEAGTLWTTDNGGNTWIQTSFPKTAAANLAVYPPVLSGRRGTLPVQVSSRQPFHGWVVFRTRDAGRTWRPGAPVHASGASTIALVGGSHAVTTRGRRVYVTANGGDNWSRISPNMSRRGVSQLQFLSPKVGFAVISGGPEAKLLKTTDGGHIWAPVA